MVVATLFHLTQKEFEQKSESQDRIVFIFFLLF